MVNARMHSVAPIGDTDPLSLPVANVEKAAAYYTEVLGFTLKERPPGMLRTVTLTRDDVMLGLAESGGDPEQASCYINVSDVAALQQEYAQNGVNVSAVGPMEHDGRQYQVFWAKDLDGICYCIGREGS